ncbi:MAG: four helix bundle protein [Candidatus Omnitrophica bacterium]|nr:four helix bundle protein [Candidatus Omnitrophota bacterium]
MRVKISRKEAKESRYWLKLSEPRSKNIKTETILINKTTELLKILRAIIERSK